MQEIQYLCGHTVLCNSSRCLKGRVHMFLQQFAVSHLLVHILTQAAAGSYTGVKKENTQIANRLHCNYKACHVRVMLIVQLSNAVVYVLVV